MLDPDPCGRGAPSTGRVDVPEHPYVRLTQRGRPPRERRSLWGLLALVLAGHVLLAWLAYLVLRPSPFSQRDSGVFRVMLIEPESALPAPPPLVPPPPLPGQPAPAPPRHYERPAPGAISATLEGAQGQPLRLYQSNGQIQLPPSGAPPETVPAYRAPELRGSQIYSGKSPVPYQPTRFNKDWAPSNQSLGAKTVGRVFDKAVEKTTVVKTVHLPGGIKIKCGVSPLVLALGCVSSPPPPPPSDRLENDIRLSMPPPETLTGKKVPVPSSAASVPAPASGGP